MRQMLSIALQSIITIFSLLLMVAYLILLERKILGQIQKRRGPNITGILGLLQPIADALKLILKETIVPGRSNKGLFLISPGLSLSLSLLNWSIVPFNFNWIISDINISILFFFAVSSLSTYGVLLAGWSSNSKYAFLGCLRASAQIIAYEVSIGVILLIIIYISQDLNYITIILEQQLMWFIIPCNSLWALFLIASLAETNRPPFDLPEAEAELVSGYNVEYSAMSFGYFFLAEYVSIITISIINIICFFGGWTLIFKLNYIINIIVFSLKLLLLIILFIWVRGSIPRYRYDQLMRLGWKVLLPLALGLSFLLLGTIFYFILKIL